MKDLFAEFRQDVVQWIARGLDKHVRQTYSTANDHVHRSPPSLKYKSARKYVVASADAAWELMEKAHTARANVAQAIALKDDEDNLGCGSSRGGDWLNKWLQMNNTRSELAFGLSTPYHWNLMSDPGMHSYKECLVSVLYSWELNLGCFPNWQYLLPGKQITPKDCNMMSEVKPYAARAKCERVASYRQLQTKINKNNKM